MIKTNLSTIYVKSLTNKRENNEDNYLILPIAISPQVTWYLLAVADGMGGHEHGEIVSEEALRKLSQTLIDQICIKHALSHEEEYQMDIEKVKSILYESIQITNNHIIKIMETNNWGLSGSTIVAALVINHSVVAANLGDSPLFHFFGENQQLIQITDDHSVAGAMVRAGAMTKEFARFHPGKYQLEFFIGKKELPKTPPVHVFETQSGDILLLCSDGISGAMDESAIELILKDKKLNLEEKGDALFKKSVESGEEDNQTLLIWEFTPKPPQRESKKSKVVNIKP